MYLLWIYEASEHHEEILVHISSLIYMDIHFSGMRLNYNTPLSRELCAFLLIPARSISP